MVFQKGNIPWNKGKVGVYSEATLERIRIYRIGKKASKETRKKMSLNAACPWLGKKLPKETRKKMSLMKKGKKLSEQHRKKISIVTSGENNPRYGIRLSEELRNRISKSLIGNMLGEKHWNWKGGKQIWTAKLNNKRREKGFVLIISKNPYEEPIEYHHVNPKLPLVIPCPTRIHRLFKGKFHHENVNAMLGFRIADWGE